MSLIKVVDAAYKYHYDDTFVFTDLTFSVDTGDVCTLLIDKFGGKTTLAKVLVGLLKLTKGEILFNGQPLDLVPPERRNFAYIAYPTLYLTGTTLKNVAHGLRLRKVSRKNAYTVASQRAEEYGLGDYLNEKVKKLSESNRMRLAFARAFCREVTLLIVDGCFGVNEETDNFLKTQIEQKAAGGCAVLVLASDKKYAFGKVYDFLPEY